MQSSFHLYRWIPRSTPSLSKTCKGQYQTQQGAEILFLDAVLQVCKYAIFQSATVCHCLIRRDQTRRWERSSQTRRWRQHQIDRMLQPEGPRELQPSLPRATWSRKLMTAYQSSSILLFPRQISLYFQIKYNYFFSFESKLSSYFSNCESTFLREKVCLQLYYSAVASRLKSLCLCLHFNSTPPLIWRMLREQTRLLQWQRKRLPANNRPKAAYQRATIVAASLCLDSHPLPR